MPKLKIVHRFTKDADGQVVQSPGLACLRRLRPKAAVASCIGHVPIDNRPQPAAAFELKRRQWCARRN